MKEQRAQGRQLDLLMLAGRDLAPQLFDPATRSEIVNLLKILLSDHVVTAVRIPEGSDD
jgi:hypothetical protein